MSKIVKRRRQKHNLQKLKLAVAAVKNHDIKISRAAETFLIPRATLFDRLHGRIKEDSDHLGPETTLDRASEQDLVNHIAKLASLGYGYSRAEVIGMATDLAHFKKRLPIDKQFSSGWARGFFRRWPQLSCLKPRATEIYRAKCATPEAMSSYFRNLKEIMDKYEFQKSPENIFNLDETGVTTDHNPQKVVAFRNKRPAAIVSGRSSTTTVLACGNAIGNALPPFLIFKGKRNDENLMQGASVGAQMMLSESGWSNSAIFKEYLETHFMRYVRPDRYKLLLYDGHASHVNQDVIEWARENRVVVFVLPPHTSHVSQPLDVGCFGPFKRCLSAQTSTLMRNRPGTAVTRYDLCGLICRAYGQAVTSSNIQASFRKTGIYPLDKDAISKEQLMPSALYSTMQQREAEEAQGPVTEENASFFKDKTPFCPAAATDETKKREAGVRFGGNVVTEGKIYKELKKKNKKFQAPIKKQDSKTAAARKLSGNGKECVTTEDSQKAGPSGLQQHADTDYDTETLDSEEMCCICKKWQPPKMRRQLRIVQWAQCGNESCKHWTHLEFCCDEREVKEDEDFFCPHCKMEQ